MLRKLLPPDRSDYIPFFLFAFLTPTAIAIEFKLLLPKIFEGQILNTLYGVIGYLFVCMYFCWFKLVTVDTTTRGVVLPVVMKPDWKFCWACSQNSPPRSQHCHRCNICVLRFDHHCYFSGRCVGYNNYRYFVSLVSIAWLLCLVLLVTNFDYVISECGGLNLRTLMLIFFPSIAWLLGLTRELPFLIVMVLLMSILGLLFSSYLLLYHSPYLHTGLTTYERNRKMSKYKSKSKSANIKSVFGDKLHFALLILFPYLNSELKGDGTIFEMVNFTNTRTL